MAIELNRRYGAYGATVDRAYVDEALRAYMLKVYNLMASGLFLSGVVAVLTFQAGLAQYGIIGSLAALGVMLLMSFRANSMSAGTVSALYWVFTVLMGFGLGGIFLRYGLGSILQVFFVTAGTFGAMSLWGYTTKRDLTGMGHFLMMGVVGLLLAGIGMMVWSMISGGVPQWLHMAFSAIGVIVFTLLTAYDTQQIKNDFDQSAPDELTQKQAIFGAVSLYLNFVNLFQFLLALLGNRDE